MPSDAQEYMRGLEAAHLIVLALLDQSVHVVEWSWRDYARQTSDDERQVLVNRFDSIDEQPRAVELRSRASNAIDRLVDKQARVFLHKFLDDEGSV